MSKVDGKWRNLLEDSSKVIFYTQNSPISHNWLWDSFKRRWEKLAKNERGYLTSTIFLCFCNTKQTCI